jgi:hypothetical protein
VVVAAPRLAQREGWTEAVLQGVEGGVDAGALPRTVVQ